MYRSSSARPHLTGIVLLLSVLFGIVLVVTQMKPAPPTGAPPALRISTGVPALPSPQPAAPAFFLSIPSLGVTAPIVHLAVDNGTWDVHNLGNNAGHLLGTAWFDNAIAGNIVFAGHVELRDGTRGIFAGLSSVPTGESIVIHSGSWSRRYLIEASYETDPSDLGPLYASQREIVTLITCSDYDWLGNTYHRRHVVVARASDSE